MSAQTETLFSLEAVTDHDCGNYEIGEIDFRIHGALEKYIRSYGYEGKRNIHAMLGYEGKRNIHAMLGYLHFHVEKVFRDVANEQENPAKCVKQEKGL